MNKRLFVSIIIAIVLIIPIKANALDYSCSISGSDILKSKNARAFNPYTNMNISISNVQNIGSLTMYVQYDNSKVGLSTCHLLNYIGGGCYMSGNNIFYDYRFSEGLLNDLSNYPFYTVTFMPKDSTPESGTTQVTVSFQNAKDRNQNPITINSCNKTYTFTNNAIGTINSNSNNSSDGNSNSNTNNTSNANNNATNSTNNTSKSSSQDNVKKENEVKTDKDEKKSDSNVDEVEDKNSKDLEDKKEKINSEKDIKKNNTTKASNKNIKKNAPNYLIIGSVLAGAIFIITIISAIIFTKNKKLNKQFDEFDKM